MMVVAIGLAACTGGKPVADDGGGDDTDRGADDSGWVDLDGDGYPAEEDCDDEDGFVYPGATDFCNGIDDDCSGAVDDSGTVYPDADGDGYGVEEGAMTGRSCPESAESWVAGDCDDADPAVYPTAEEACDGPDVNCDGVTSTCPTPLEASARWFIQNTLRVDARMGAGASSSGDIDGDGGSDLLLGGSNNFGSDGTLYLFRSVTLRHMTGVVDASEADWTIEGQNNACPGWSGDGAALLPDMDGDGRADVIVGSYGESFLVPSSAFGDDREIDLESASASVLSAPSDPDAYAGLTVGAAGDVDGDGIPDVLVGGEGVVWAVPGSFLASAAVDISEGIRFDDESYYEDEYGDGFFGFEPVQAGDVDGDGLDDLLIACHGCDATTDYGGAAYLYWGSGLSAGSQLEEGDADVTLVGPYHGWVGRGLVGAVDLDGDGRDDWATTVGNVSEDGEGAVLLWYDTASGPSTLSVDDASARLDDANGGGYAGYAIAADDFDGDGAADLVVQDWYPELDTYLLPNTGIPRSGDGSLAAAETIYAPEDPDRWGRSVLRMDGDLDADGLDDLLVAYPSWAPDAEGRAYGAALVIPGH